MVDDSFSPLNSGNVYCLQIKIDGRVQIDFVN